MKKVRINLIVLLAILFFAASCDKGDYYDDFDNLNDEWGEYEDGDYNDNEEGEDSHAHSGETVYLTSYRISGNQITKKEDFDVGSDFLHYQQDIGTHQKMWNYYTSLIPIENRSYITEFIVFHGQNDLAGYVEPIDESDLSKWRMGLAIDHAGDLDNINIKEDFAYTTIHEFAHVLTLNSSQIDAGGSAGTCPNFHTGEGCSKADSYINTFYKLGWADIYEKFLDYEDPYEFHQKYRDRFVTDYAASNPGEDIAEVFTVFVVQDQPSSGSSIAAQKVNMMYNYPELVELRNKIRASNPVLRAMQPGSWVKKGKRRRH